MALSVRVAQASDAREWDEYVIAHREGRFCHRCAYREVLERVYGYKGVYLQILADGDLAGVFPTMLCGRGARRLISQPFNEYGGPLTGELTANQYEELGGLLLEVAADHGCESYEIRGGLNIGVEDDTTGWARHKLYQYAVLDMDGFTDPATDAFKRQAKKSTRRAVEAGLEVDILRGVIVSVSGLPTGSLEFDSSRLRDIATCYRNGPRFSQRLQLAGIRVQRD